MSELSFDASGYGDSSGLTGGEELLGESTGQGTEEAGTWDAGEQAGTQDEPVYEIDGKSYTLSELRELIKGGMLERDYRIKTAQLAEERRQIEQLRQAAEAWMALQQYPELVELIYNKALEMLSGGGQQGQGQQAAAQAVAEAMGGEDNPLAREIQTLRQQLAALQADYQQRVNAYNQYLWQQYYAQREAYARGQLQNLKSKYPFLYEEEVVEAFKMDPNADLEALAQASHEHWYKFYREREKGNVQQRVENAKARVVAPSVRGTAAGAAAKTPTDWDDARKAALAILSQMGARK